MPLLVSSAIGADARHQEKNKHAFPFGGALDIASFLRVFLSSMGRFFLLLSLAISANADSGLLFSISGILFDPSVGFETGNGASISVTGLDTPLNSGVTVSGVGGGFNWNPTVVGSNASFWHFQATDIIIEAQFDFGTGFSPIPIFAYSPTGETQSFDLSRTPVPSTFIISVDMPIDVRLAAFYGLAPACSAPFPPVGCSNPDFPSGVSSTALIAQGNGANMFSASIMAAVVPEPATSLLMTIAASLLVLIKLLACRANSNGRPPL